MTTDITPAPKLDPNCPCVCHTQPGVMHVVACCQAPAADITPENVVCLRIITTKGPPNSDGQKWVHWADYQHLKAERDALAAQRDDLAEQARQAHPTMQRMRLAENKANARADAAEKKLAEVEAIAWRLRSYAVHDDDCKINRHPHYRDCSCGLNAAKATMEKQHDR
jgi:hypothetical protein